MNLGFPASGLYVITKTDGYSPQRILASVSAAIRGGARVIQYRDKITGTRLNIATELLTICHKSNIPLIINDNIGLAADIGADGVHLGKQDGDIETAKNVLGRNSIIGVSCYGSVERAISAQHQGATYVAFGRFFQSKSKPSASCADLDVLRQARLKIPIVAIGGITVENGKTLLDAGADLVAVIDAVCGQEKPEQAAKQFQMLFHNPKPVLYGHTRLLD